MSTHFSTLVSRTQSPVVPLSLLKTYVRQDHADDDVLLTTLLDAATLQAEDYVQIALGQQVREMRHTGTPAEAFKLDMGPVQSVVSVTYTNTLGETVVLADTEYTLDGDTLYPVDAWPSTNPHREGLFRVKYVTGVANPDVSPPVELTNEVVTGILLLSQMLYTRMERENGLLKESAYRMLDTVRKGQGL